MPDLSGKDYFNEKQAAEYCCVSISQFRAKIQATDLRPGKMWGKKVYRRSDLQKLIEETAWQQSNGEGTSVSQARPQRRPSLIGVRGANSVARV